MSVLGCMAVFHLQDTLLGMADSINGVPPCVEVPVTGWAEGCRRRTSVCLLVVRWSEYEPA